MSKPKVSPLQARAVVLEFAKSGEETTIRAALSSTEPVERLFGTEILRHSDKGVRKWVRTGKRDNHYLDCEIYAAVAGQIAGVKRLKPIEKDPEPEVPVPPVQRPRGPDPRMARRGL